MKSSVLLDLAYALVSPTSKHDAKLKAIETIYEHIEKLQGESRHDDLKKFLVSLISCDIPIVLLSLVQSVERSLDSGFKPVYNAENGISIQIADISLLILSTISGFRQQNSTSMTWQEEALETMQLVLEPFEYEGEIFWPVKVLSHENGFVAKSAKPASNLTEFVKENVTVLDVLETCIDGIATPIRMLIIGCWKGPNQFRESETDLTSDAGTELLNFYCTTLVGLTAYNISANPDIAPKVLIIGLGGGVIVSFLAKYCPGFYCEAVELMPGVARAAEKYFGLKCTPSLVGDEEKDVPGFAQKIPMDSISNHRPISRKARMILKRQRQKGNICSTNSAEVKPCKLFVMDARTFLKESLSEVYDFVILDVYTAEKFPDNLLKMEFFSDIRKVLKPNGSVAINSGYGADEQAVLHYVNAIFGNNRVRIFLDENAIKENDREYENAVIYATRNDEVNLTQESWKQWETQTSIRLPFTLDCARAVSDVENNMYRLFWKENSMKADAASEVKFAEKSDKVWDIFD